MNRARLAPGVAIACLVLAACSYIDRQSEPFRPATETRAVPAGGQEIYQRDCAWCHGGRGAGTANGPPIVGGTGGPAAVDFVLQTGRMPLDDPTEPMIHRDPTYNDEEIADLVAYVETFGSDGPAVPAVDVDGADLTLGNELFQENCAACHSTTGVGGALTAGHAHDVDEFSERSGIVAPSLDEVDARETAEAIRVGPGTMPVFSEETFDQEELNAIVAYVIYLQNPDEPGGADLGRIGPVAEGAVGWIVGAGILLLLVRWIGTKRGEV